MITASMPDAARSRKRWLIAAAALLIALLMFWITRDDPARTPASKPLQERAASSPRVIRDGAVTITVDDDGEVESVTSPREDWTALLTAALRHGRLPPRYDARALAPPVPPPRGEEHRAAVRLLQPVGVVVESDRPFFRWSGVPEAFYRVAVTQDGEPVAKSELQSGRMWIPHAPLARGAIYEWQVTALIGQTESAYPPPGQPPARFKVLSAPEFAELEAARKTGSKLLVDLVAARLGLGEVSAREIDRMLTSSSPHPR